MKVTIWIPDKLVDEIKESAWEARTSLSNYLVQLHRNATGFTNISQTKGYLDAIKRDLKPADAIADKKVICEPKSWGRRVETGKPFIPDPKKGGK